MDFGTVRIAPGHASLHVLWQPPFGVSADSYIVKHRIAGSAEVMGSVKVTSAASAPSTSYEGSRKNFHHQITGLTPGVQYEVAVHRVVGDQWFPIPGDLAETSGAERWLQPWVPPRTLGDACYPPWFYPKLPHYPEAYTPAQLTQWLWDYERSDAKESQRMLTDAEAGNWTGDDLDAGATGRIISEFMDSDSGQLLVYVNLTDEASALAAIEWIVRHGGSGEVWYGPSRPHIDNQPGILGSIPLPLVGELSELPGVIYVNPDPAPLEPMPVTPIELPTPTPEETP